MCYIYLCIYFFIYFLNNFDSWYPNKPKEVNAKSQKKKCFLKVNMKQFYLNNVENVNIIYDDSFYLVEYNSIL